MTMNKGPSKQSPNNDLLVSIIQPFVELLAELIQLSVVCFEKLIRHSVGSLISRANGTYKEKRKKITKVMTFVTKQTVALNSFGYSASHRRDIVFDEIPFFQHLLIIGRTGQGKSNGLLNILDRSFRLNHAIFYLDPKGNRSAVNEFKFVAEYYKKTALIFSETNLCNFKINPMKGLNNAQRVTLIANSFEFSDGTARYYKDVTLDVLLSKVFPHIENRGKVVSFPEILRTMDLHFFDDEYRGFLVQLRTLMESPFGDHFEDEDDSALSMLDIVDERACVYFGLSVQGYSGIGRTLGKIFLNGIQQVSHMVGLRAETSENPEDNPICVVNEEAGSFLFKDFVNLQNKSRSSGIYFINMIQALDDFDEVSPTFRNIILANTGVLMVFNLPLNDNAEDLGKIIGTFESISSTNVTMDGERTNMGTQKEAFEYLAHPQTIKDLNRGQCILSSKSPSNTYLVNVKYAYELESIKYMKKRLQQIATINSTALSAIKSPSKESRLLELIDRNSTSHVQIERLRNKSNFNEVKND